MTAILILLLASLGGTVLGYVIFGLAGAVPGFIVGLITSGYALGDRLSLKAIGIGAACAGVTLIIGTLGPMILWPESGIAPAIGWVFAPVALLVGTVVGFLIYARPAANAPPPEKIAFFTTFAAIAILGINISLMRYMWTPLVPVFEEWRASDEIPMPEIASAGVLRIWTVDNRYWVNTHGTAVPKEFGEAVLASDGTVKITALDRDQFPAALTVALADETLPDIIGGLDSRAIWNALRSRGVADQFVRITGDLLPIATHGGLVGGLGRLGSTLVLNTRSSQIELARKVLLTTPTICPDSWVGSYAPKNRDLAILSEHAISAFVANDAGAMDEIRDPAMLAPPPRQESPLQTYTHGAHVCAMWGNDRLQFALVDVVYETDRALGQLMYVLVVRKSEDRWRVLAAAPFMAPVRDLVFRKSDLAASMKNNSTLPAPLMPATLLAPLDGEKPAAEPGTSYGSYRWHPSPSDSVTMEVLELACRYRDGRPLTRLAPLMYSGRNQVAIRGQISERNLRSGSTSCLWRVWSIADTGEIAFSEVHRLPGS